MMTEPCHAEKQGDKLEPQDCVEWRIVPFASRYLVSSEGYIYSTIRAGRLLKQTIGPHGYPYVSLMIDGKPKKFCVHRVVADTFLPGGGETVNHKDGVKTNNNLSNLEWMLYSENNKHARETGLSKCHGSNHHSSILTEDDVSEIRRRAASGELHKVIAERFGTDRRNVTKIVNRRSWRHVE